MSTQRDSYRISGFLHEYKLSNKKEIKKAHLIKKVSFFFVLLYGDILENDESGCPSTRRHKRVRPF